MKVQNLSKSFSNASLFQSLSFTCKSGIVLLKGKSGCGKSTLIKILMGLEKPTSGIVEAKEEEKDYLYLGEKTFLLDYYSLEENLSFFLHEKLADETIQNAEKLKVKNLLSIKLSELSAGQRQKMEFLFLLQSHHHTYYLDEPFSSWDQESKKIGIDLLNEKAKNSLCFLITHDDIPISYQIELSFQKTNVTVIKKEEGKSFSLKKEKAVPALKIFLNYFLHKKKGYLIFQCLLFSFSLFFFFFGLSNTVLLSSEEKQCTMWENSPFSYHETRLQSESLKENFFEQMQDGIIQYKVQFQNRIDQLFLLSCLKEENNLFYVKEEKPFLSDEELICLNENTNLSITTKELSEISSFLPDSLFYRSIKDGIETLPHLLLCSPSFLDSFLSAHTISFSNHPQLQVEKPTFSFQNGVIIDKKNNPDFKIERYDKDLFSIPNVPIGTEINSNRDTFSSLISIKLFTTNESTDDSIHIGINNYKHFLLYAYSEDINGLSSNRFNYILSKEEYDQIKNEGTFLITDQKNLIVSNALGERFLLIGGILFLSCFLFPILSYKGNQATISQMNHLLSSHNLKAKRIPLYLFFFYFVFITILLSLFYLFRKYVFIPIGDFNFMLQQYGANKKEGFYYYSQQPLNDYFDSIVKPIPWQKMNSFDFLPLLSYLFPFIYSYFLSKKQKN